MAWHRAARVRGARCPRRGGIPPSRPSNAVRQAVLCRTDREEELSCRLTVCPEGSRVPLKNWVRAHPICHWCAPLGQRSWQQYLWGGVKGQQGRG